MPAGRLRPHPNNWRTHPRAQQDALRGVLAEIGYALSTEFQRQGLMPHAITQLLGDLFLQTRLERIEARCATDNEASQKVLERVGFTLEGRLRGYFVLAGERVDNYLFAILRDDFLPPSNGN